MAKQAKKFHMKPKLEAMSASLDSSNFYSSALPFINLVEKGVAYFQSVRVPQERSLSRQTTTSQTRLKKILSP